MAARRQNRLLSEGVSAPDFQLARLGGGQTSLEDLTMQGQVLLVFFKVTCPVCQFTLPYFERLHQSGKLAVVGISQNDEEDTRDFNRQFGITFPTLLDPEDAFEVSNAYGISSVPTSFLVAPDDTVIRVIEGWRKREVEALGKMAGAVLIRQGDNVPEWKAG